MSQQDHSSTPLNAFDSQINSMFSNRNMFIDFDASENKYHIYNHNDDRYYDIYISVYENCVDLNIISHIVRHDNSIVTREDNINNVYFTDIPKYIKPLYIRSF